jgi:hypothetical protein
MNNIFEFWKICCQKVASRNLERRISTENHFLFYFVFHLPSNWYHDEKLKDYIRSNKFLEDLKKTKLSYQENINAYVISFYPQTKS